MVKLTNEMKDALKVVGKGGTVVYLATASADGKPNNVGMRFITTIKDEFILIADMFFIKTKANLKESFLFVNGTEKIYPDLEWHGINAKDVLEEWGNWAEKEPPVEVPPDIRPPVARQRGVYCLHVEEVLSLKAGEVGKKVL